VPIVGRHVLLFPPTEIPFCSLASNADNVLKYSVAKRVQRETNDSCIFYCRENSVYIQVKGCVLKGCPLGIICRTPWIDHKYNIL
jgi:hypothetical protein